MNMVTPVVRRFGAETWRDALARAGELMGEAHALLYHFDQLVSRGCMKPESAVREVMRVYQEGTGKVALEVR